MDSHSDEPAGDIKRGINQDSADKTPPTDDGVRILVVDDQSNVRDVFKTILSLKITGCRVDVAVNGAEAVDMFRQIRHDILLMDLHMPVMDGETAFYEIQKLCKNEGIRMPAVIFCTGYSPSEKFTQRVAADPLHCILHKPVTSGDLMAAIQPRLKIINKLPAP